MKNTLMQCLLFFIFINSYSQDQSKFRIDQVSFTNWDPQQGVLYQKVPGANLGVVSFEMIDSSRLAFLCNSNSELVIIEKTTGKAVNKFPVIIGPRDFIYENEYFFILGEYYVVKYNFQGKELNRFEVPKSNVGTERIARYNNSTYLLLSSGNSLLIESNGRAVRPIESEGWITSTGHFIITHFIGHEYSVKVKNMKGIKEKYFSADKKVAGVYVIGFNEKYLILDIQTFISERPILVERNIGVVLLDNNGLSSKIEKIKVPDCYYVLSNKDITIYNGKILNMVTHPDGIYVLSISSESSDYSNGYPAKLSSFQYHFNDHLLKVE